jgi:phospholipid/cholesterol/gamma-HCH transport system substrate-binding protein
MPAPRDYVVGLFVIGGILLFAAGLFLIGDRRQLFSKDFEIYAEFKELGGLQDGAKVKVGGMDAGEVLDIQVPAQPQAKFRVKMRILEKLHAVVRSDSVATIQTEGVLGNKFLKVDPGTAAAPAAPAGSTIPGREPFDFADLIQQLRDTVDQVQVKMDSVFASISTTTEHADQLISSVQDDVQSIISSSKQISNDARVIIAGAKNGRGVVGRLFTDENLADNVSGFLRDFQKTAGNTRQISQQFSGILADFQNRQILQELEQTAQNIRQLTARANEIIVGLQSKGPNGETLTADLGRTVTVTREAMSDLAENMEALKRNFFFRGFFKKRGFYDLDKVSLAEYQAGKFGNGKLNKRTWIHETELFSTSPKGEELSDAGKRKLDGTMADFSRYIQTSPIIVEGYSGRGTTDQQFLNSRERATKVRDYLIQKFELDPNYIGIMPMGAIASKGPKGG